MTNLPISLSQIELTSNRIIFKVIKEPAKETVLEVDSTQTDEEPNRDQYYRAEIVAVGPGEYDEDAKAIVPTTAKVGDKVLVNVYRYGATEDTITLLDGEFHIAYDSRIIAFIK